MSEISRLFRLGLLLTLSTLWLLPVQAEIYRWIDADGQVHFTDAPPPNKGEKVDVDIAPPSKTPDEGERRRRALLESVEVRAKHDAEVKKQTDAEDAAAKAKVDAADQYGNGVCQDARDRYYVLTQELAVYWTAEGTLRPFYSQDTYRGERSYIDDAQRQRLLAQANQQIATTCPNGEVDDEEGSFYAAWLRSERCLVRKSDLQFELEGNKRPSKQRLRDLKADLAKACS